MTIFQWVNNQFISDTWKSYDNCLTRLRCARNDEFKQIMPPNGDPFESIDTPIFACKFAQKDGMYPC